MDTLKRIIDSIMAFFAGLGRRDEPKPAGEVFAITHSEVKLLYPRVQAIFQKLVNKIKDAGLDADIFMGLRTFEEQAKLYAKGRTEPGSIVTNSKPGYSFHNYGLAVDVVFKKSGGWSWDASHDWSLLGRIGRELGLKWGGDWGWDKPHFELDLGHKIEELLEVFNKSKDLEDVWAHLDVAPEPI